MADKPSPKKSSLTQAARHLADALDIETRFARSGALDDLVSAASAKQAAFAAFSEIRAASPNCEILDAEDRAALEMLLVSANESAIVLEAVKSTLDHAADRLHDLLTSVADPGTYARFGRPALHVMAAHIDARA